ncbi:glycosyltransferase family 2 protein [Luteolibacter yonseiensis]|uniref:Glycosyltransferase family 2 protein n=1 Tax=Luteolibacter yonseiensis TaxID=1144680 RepID=A0A934R0S9_9BACT|nr:glycosyltransferase family 2 protein [Luteolibacter yonseiensis]MBK1814382.1 glycosyltransferase family 2 protein [Luteolibacter yonseiensis]
MTDSPDTPRLLVVMPVFNEQASVEEVVRSWMAVLDETVGDFTLLTINDGSTDGTEAKLQDLAARFAPRMELLSRPNRGHGQTCVQGYLIALERKIPHILQIDSDGQSSPDHFADFWVLRDRFDVIYGKRSRRDGFRRVLASQILRTSLKLLTRADCVDANVPYRLMTGSSCASAIRAIPPDFDLANVALSVLLRKMPAIRHGQVPIGFPPRLGGEPSVPFFKFATKARELFQQLRTSGIAAK